MDGDELIEVGGGLWLLEKLWVVCPLEEVLVCEAGVGHERAVTKDGNRCIYGTLGTAPPLTTTHYQPKNRGSLFGLCALSPADASSFSPT